MRQTRTARTLQGGCFICHGTEAVWFSPNAQAVAARHHDATGHPTWVDVVLMVRYGPSLEEESASKAATEATE